MSFEKEKSAGFLANHMARLFAHGLQARIRHLDLATGQFMVLLELWLEDGLTQKQLVERLDVEQATMANTLTRMERDGLVRRKPHPGDGRAQQVWMTPRAKTLYQPATEAAAAQNALALSDLSDAERGQFIALMNRVIAVMRNARDDHNGS